MQHARAGSGGVGLAVPVAVAMVAVAAMQQLTAARGVACGARCAR